MSADIRARDHVIGDFCFHGPYSGLNALKVVWYLSFGYKSIVVQSIDEALEFILDVVYQEVYG